MNTITTAFANRLLLGEANWSAMAARVQLVDETYVFDRDDPQPVTSPIATSALMTGLDVVAGWAKAGPVSFNLNTDLRLAYGAVIIEELETLPIVLMDDIVGFPMVIPNSIFWMSWNSVGIFHL